MPRGYVEISRDKLEQFLQGCGFGRRVIGGELVYVIHNHHYHSVLVKVYTSLPKDGGNSRGSGKDAIRVTVAYESDLPYRGRTSFGLYKSKAIYRTGSEAEVLDRLHVRMREAYMFANNWLRDNLHNLPKRAN